MMLGRYRAAVLVGLLFVTTSALAQQKQEYLSAQESEPSNFGWMQGFPPPSDKVLSVSDGSFFEFPAIRWSVEHMRELLPTVDVSGGLDAPVSLEYERDKSIDSLKFLPWEAQDSMTWETSLWKNYTDGIIVLHQGKVVYERYFSELTESDVHAVMSLTKSFTGTLAAALVAEGVIDENKLVSEYVPELKNSAFGDATVRQVMDMTTALQYSEDYANPDAEVWDFSAAGSPLPKPEGYDGPRGYYQYLETVKKDGQHGEAFGYKTVNADALGWIIAKATGKSVAELLSDKVWSKLGVEQDSYYQVDGLGTPFAGGGFNAGLRDLARFGEMIRNQGQWQGKQIIPAEAVADIEKGGSPAKFAKSDHPKLEGWSYRDMWWSCPTGMTENEHKAFMPAACTGRPSTSTRPPRWSLCGWPRTR